MIEHTGKLYDTAAHLYVVHEVKDGAHTSRVSLPPLTYKRALSLAAALNVAYAGFLGVGVFRVVVKEGQSEAD